MSASYNLNRLGRPHPSIDQHPYDDPPSDDEGFDSDDSEGHDLLDVSSDVEMYPDELDGLDSDARWA